MDKANIARVCHEVNRAVCEAYGDLSQVPWGDAPGWQQTSAIDGVVFRLTNPDATAADQHDAWTTAKYDAGWRYGPVKDAEALTHPCMVPYQQLPLEQQVKDHVFAAIVEVCSQID